jgi:hypothetical protein
MLLVVGVAVQGGGGGGGAGGGGVPPVPPHEPMRCNDLAKNPLAVDKSHTAFYLPAATLG